jgi:hypothetical protein
VQLQVVAVVVAVAVGFMEEVVEMVHGITTATT